MTQKTTSQLLLELIESLTQAAGGANGLVYLSGNAPGFMMLRDAIDVVKAGVNKMASFQVIADQGTVH